MIPVDALRARWADGPLGPLAARLEDIVARGLSPARHGDLPRWLAQLAALPDLSPSDTVLDRGRITVRGGIDSARRIRLEHALRGLQPWRKGPYELFGVVIDTEWRSDWKWERLAGGIAPLAGRRVLDVGCGNGYHCWRMRGAGAAEVLGIDPAPLFNLQFQAVQRYIRDPAVTLLPMRVEQLPADLAAFDTVFSMGVLYHRRSPLEHLTTLRHALRPGGELVLETLVVEGDATRCLVPEGRYACMGNVWFIPSAEMLQSWLRKLGWQAVRLVDDSVTGTAEQRRTDWMHFHSLAEFLDPQDPSRTREGHPAPRRAIVVAEAP